MMSKWAAVIVAEDGRVLEAFGKQRDEYPEGLVVVFDPPQIFDPTKVLVVDGGIVDMPPQPSDAMLFDTGLGEWVDPNPPSLEQAKFKATRELGELVGDARRAYITPIAGQEMVYAQKAAEARAYLVAGDPDLADFPLLRGEVGITGDNPLQVAHVWLYMAERAANGLAVIEKQRFTAAVSIQEACTLSELAVIKAEMSEVFKECLNADS